MVPTYLKQASHLDRESCKHSTETSYESIMPVFGTDQYFYKNSFCTRCNFVKHYQLLNLTAKCKTEITKHENPYQRFMNCFFKVFHTKTITNYIKSVIEIYMTDGQPVIKQANIKRCAPLI